MCEESVFLAAENGAFTVLSHDAFHVTLIILLTMRLAPFFLCLHRIRSVLNTIFLVLFVTLKTELGCGVSYSSHADLVARLVHLLTHELVLTDSLGPGRQRCRETLRSNLYIHLANHGDVFAVIDSLPGVQTENISRPVVGGTLMANCNIIIPSELFVVSECRYVVTAGRSGSFRRR